MQINNRQYNFKYMELSRDYLDTTLSEMRTRRGDTTEVEVKRAAGGLPRDIGTTICAFANMPDGGLIVLEVSEAGGFSINGVDDVAGMEAAIVNVARNAVSPHPFVDTKTIDYAGLPVVLARVEGLPPREKPARFKGKAYLRQADGDYVMSSADLHLLDVARLNDTERTNSDSERVAGTTLEDLDQDLVTTLLKQARSQSSRLRNLDDQTVLRQLGVMTPKKELTVAGVYALGNLPQGLLPALQVTAAVQLPRDGGAARTQNLRHFDGPLPELLDELVDWTTANLTTRQQYQTSGHIRDVPEMPLPAIRETIANALVHRDLSTGTLGLGRSIQVRITDRVLTVTSPGGLRGLTLSQITSSSPAQAAVNQRLYRIAKYLRTRDGENVIEGEGGGVKEILRSTLEFDLHRPQLIDNGVQFTANLWRGSAFSPEDSTWLAQNAEGHKLTHLQKQVLLKARDSEPWDIDTLRKEFSPLSSIEAEDQLSELVRWKLVDINIEQRVPTAVTSDNLSTETLLSNSWISDSESVPLDTATSAHNDLGSKTGTEQQKMSKNAPQVLDAISQGAETIPEIARTLHLNDHQVRYALKTLETHGRVVMIGGRGHKSTRYTLADGDG